MKGRRIILVYALALAAAVFLQFDKVESWLTSKFSDGLPGWLAAAVDTGETLHTDMGLARLSLALDCSTAGLFDGTYKKTYRCQDAALADVVSSVPQGDARTLAQQAPEKNEVAIAPKLSPPVNVLVVGDSLAIALAVSLEKAFKEYDGLNMIPKGKIASGLQNPQYFNWEEALRQFIKEYDAKLVVVMMGANDAKYLNLDPESTEPAALADRHRTAYEARLKKFLSIMDEKGVVSYWVGLPIMGDPDLSARSKALNAIVRQTCQGSSHGHYLDTWSLLSDAQGNYAQHIVDGAGHRLRVREGDKIHFSTAGGDIIVKALMQDAGELVVLKPKGSKEMAQAPAHSEAAAQ